MSIWQSVKDEIKPTVLRGDVIRVVESQEQIATTLLVDDLEEQIQLEKLLEQSKPEYTQNIQKQLHYLLTTPFRYPPLFYGSRFGSRFEPSIFYGSKSLSTAFSETAFYRFYFWQGMSSPPPSKKFITEHTVFSVGYYSVQSLKLQSFPFLSFKKELTDPSQYIKTQALGSAMRENGFEVFEYSSARDKTNGINIGIFYPSAFTNKKPKDQQQWLCETTDGTISFSSKEGVFLRYLIDDFLVDAKFPLPVN